jgi:hypothetical protein
MNPLVIIAAFAVIGGASTIVAVDQGYIPITQTLQIERPVGYTKLCTSCYEEKYQEILSQVPNLDKIKYEVFGSDNTYLEIYVDYKQKLEKEGYQEHTVGSKEIEGVHIRYYGFLKGITVAGIAIASGKDVNLPYESIVLYTTGSALDYQEIIDWYNQK